MELGFSGKKIIQKVVASRLIEYLDISQHSTETGLLRVQNDILTALDKSYVGVAGLVLSIRHYKPRRAAKQAYTALWNIGSCSQVFQSYLSGHSQSVKINISVSQSHSLLFGVPQGSVMGPILYTMYAAPIGDIIRKHGLSYHTIYMLITLRFR